MKIKIAIAAITVTCLLAGAYVLFSLFYDLEGGPYCAKTIFIPKGTSLTQAANILKEGGVIKSLAKFKILAAITGNSQRVKQGEYEFTVPDHPINILNKIARGKVKTYRITIPEGLRGEEIAKQIESAGLVDHKKFMALMSDPALLKKYGIQSPSLEGYLYPETYTFDKTMSEFSMINSMVARFFVMVTPDIVQKGRKLGMNLHEIVTLASMIEKETGIDDERALISSVFHNRLKKGMRLQCDPTVIYGTKDFDGNLRKRDLLTYTPYNTYMIKGLPKGPISNPGIASIRAAVEPAQTNHLFFVAKKDKSHVFSKDYRDHVNAVNRFQLKK